jgi:NAD(P)H-dependent flavin oxidoreductase YrpB (nitropropane dioxygenase family)
MWRTPFTEQYGLDVPFVSAGMGFYAVPDLVAAVSNAGGLGVLGVSPEPPARMRAMIQAVKSLTSRPFGVDFIVENAAFGPLTTKEHIDVCIAEAVPVVVFFWRLPPAGWLERLHAAGAKVWMQVGALQGALEAVRAGIDGVIVQGSEAGGHNKSTAGICALVPAVVDAIAPVPVLAAGGIADGRGVAAALALGADAVWVGTRLLASREAHAHDEYKRRLLAASVDDIARTSLFGPEWPDAPMRVIRNRVVREWAGRDGKTPPQPEPPRIIGRTVFLGQEYAMPQFSAILPTPETTGDFEEMCLAAGESAGLVQDIKPVGQIVREMMEEAEQLIEGRLVSLIGRKRIK